MPANRRRSEASREDRGRLSAEKWQEFAEAELHSTEGHSRDIKNADWSTDSAGYIVTQSGARLNAAGVESARCQPPLSRAYL